MRRVSIKQVDAFTEKPLRGNPAGVVVDASGLSFATCSKSQRK